MARVSSAMNSGRMRGHWCQGTSTRRQEEAAAVHSAKKKPRWPKGVLRQTSRPWDTASMGRAQEFLLPGVGDDALGAEEARRVKGQCEGLCVRHGCKIDGHGI